MDIHLDLILGTAAGVAVFVLVFAFTLYRTLVCLFPIVNWILYGNSATLAKYQRDLRTFTVSPRVSS